MSALWPLSASWLHAGQFFHSSRTQTATDSSKVLIFSALPHEENELLFFFLMYSNYHGENLWLAYMCPVPNERPRSTEWTTIFILTLFRCSGFTWLRELCVTCSVVSNSLDPMDYSPPGSSVHGILQARTLDWVAISFSRGSSWLRDRTLVTCIAGGCFTGWEKRVYLEDGSFLRN